MRPKEDGAHSPETSEPRPDSGLPHSRVHILYPVLLMWMQTPGGPSLAESSLDPERSLMGWRGRGYPNPPSREFPGTAACRLWEGCSATRLRHLMLFPAGGRRAEKSETPPSTSASRPRGQSTKGGGRRERGWSRRAEGAALGKGSSAQLGTLQPFPALTDPTGAQALPLGGPTLHLVGVGARLPDCSRTEGRPGPSEPAMVRRRRRRGPTPRA